MQQVTLAGDLGNKYGTKHYYYDLQTPADAIKLLCINYPELKTDLIEAHRNGVGYRVIQSGVAMNYEELQLPFGNRPLLVVPVISGSGGSAGQILTGVGLIAASFIFPGAGLFGTTGLMGAAGAGFLTTAGTALSFTGVGLVLQGTANLVSPQPQIDNLRANRIRGEGTNVRGPGPDGVTRGASGQQSYAFTGPANTVGTGATLPVIYGRVLTGSHLLASSIEVADESDPLRINIQKPGLKTVKLNGDQLSKELRDSGGILARRGSFNNLEIKTDNRLSKYRINKQFGPGTGNTRLREGNSISFDSDDGERLKSYSGDNDQREELRERLDVLFIVENGLLEFVAGSDSTRIDGFITYEVKITVTRPTNNVVVASAQSTIQGLLNETDQRLIYGTRFELPRVPKGERLDIEVKIIEAEVANRVTFKVHGYGYDLL